MSKNIMSSNIENGASLCGARRREKNFEINVDVP